MDLSMSMKRRKRRLWDDDEKCRIVAQARVPGVSVSQVARRYDVNANLVFNWLRDPRFKAAEVEDPAAAFLPVEVIAPPCDDKRIEGLRRCAGGGRQADENAGEDQRGRGLHQVGSG